MPDLRSKAQCTADLRRAAPNCRHDAKWYIGPWSRCWGMMPSANFIGHLGSWPMTHGRTAPGCRHNAKWHIDVEARCPVLDLWRADASATSIGPWSKCWGMMPSTNFIGQKPHLGSWEISTWLQAWCKVVYGADVEAWCPVVDLWRADASRHLVRCRLTQCAQICR